VAAKKEKKKLTHTAVSRRRQTKLNWLSADYEITEKETPTSF